MRSTKLLASLQRCNACRNAVLSSFIGFSRISIQPKQYHKRHIASGSSLALSISRRQRFASLAARANRDGQSSNDAVKTIDNNLVEGTSPQPDHSDTTEEAQSAQNPIPWYLQGTSQTQPPREAEEYQELPKLPDSSPPILEPLIKQISVELGLDDISLLDLRSLDPPAALGANLIMILATARSERHLHVSADRLCRWLRNSHSLSPVADGLLGRNELKLKLKRKSRRAKLLGNSATSSTTETDDGIRTGWVCVNIGTVEGNVEGATGDIEPENQQDNFVGFGRRTEHVSLVVQMLTAEKRQELDLEGLWGRFLEKDMGRDGDELFEPLENSSVGDKIHHTPSHPMARGFNHSLSTSVNSGRGFHTKACLQTTCDNKSLIESYSGRYSSSTPYSALDIPMVRDIKGIPTSLWSLVEMGDYVTLRQKSMDDVAINHSSVNAHEMFIQRALLVQAHLYYLRNISHQEARDLLGNGVWDERSTPFLLSFFKTMSAGTDEWEWTSRLRLLSFAVEIGHPAYTKKDVIALVRRMISSGTSISGETFRLACCTMLPHSYETSTGRTSHVEIEEDFRLFMELLEELHYSGFNIFTDEIIIAIHEALHASRKIDQETSDVHIGQRNHPDLALCAAYTKLMDIFTAFSFFPKSEATHLYLLGLYRASGHWDGFWKLWRAIAINMLPRSEKLYAFMFQAVAAKRSQKECIEVLRTWIPIMSQENPPIGIGEMVAQEIKSCVKIADPNVEAKAEDAGAPGEWVRLWMECSRNNPQHV